jgi:hypothetical protein
MLEGFARRVRQLFQRPTVPRADVADDDWKEDWDLPDAAGDELQLSQHHGPPPVPGDALPSKTEEEQEWEGLLSSALGRTAAAAPPQGPVTAPEPAPEVAEPSTPELTPVVQPRLELTLAPVAPASPDVEDWDAVITAARTRATAAAQPTPSTSPALAARPTPVTRPTPPAPPTPPPLPSTRALVRDRVEDLEWEAAIARARARARQASATEERLWHKAITRARTATTSVAIQRRPAAGDTADWTAAVAAAKRRPQARTAR